MRTLLVVLGVAVVAYALLIRLLKITNPRALRVPVWFLMPLFYWSSLKSILKELRAGKTMSEIRADTAAKYRAMQDRKAKESLDLPVDAPSIPDPSRPFDKALVNLGNSILAVSGFDKCKDINDAAVIVLTDMATSVLVEAGDIPVPPAASAARPAVGVCFMAACLTSMSVRLKTDGVAFDAKGVLGRAALAVFQMYDIKDLTRIIPEGTKTFQTVVAAAADRPDVKEWLDHAMILTESYVLTADRAWLAPLRIHYGSLVAAEKTF